MEPSKIFKRYGESLPNVIVFALMRNGFTELEDFIGIDRSNFQTNILQPIALTIHELKSGVLEPSDDLKAESLSMIVQPTSEGYTLAPNVQKKIFEFSQMLQDLNEEIKAEKVRKWTRLINSAIDNKWKTLLNGRSVELIDKRGNVHAKCFHPHCDTTMSVAKNYKNFNSGNFLDHIALFAKHNVVLPPAPVPADNNLINLNE